MKILTTNVLKIEDVFSYSAFISVIPGATMDEDKGLYPD
jgi:hypothetical protein